MAEPNIADLPVRAPPKSRFWGRFVTTRGAGTTEPTTLMNIGLPSTSAPSNSLTAFVAATVVLKVTSAVPSDLPFWS
jgi:hypothetical protein